MGFLTLSDINKHTARLHDHFLLAGLDIALANLIRVQWADPAEALACLSAEKREDIQSRYRDLQQRSLDLDPIIGAQEELDRLIRNGATLRRLLDTATEHLQSRAPSAYTR